MQSATQTASVGKKSLWAGRIIVAWMVIFLLFDGGVKILKVASAVEATARLGYPARLVFVIGIIELVCVVLLVIPRTSILGAILLTGYLGGATATQVRVEDPWCLFPVVIGVLVWGGLWLRDERVRAIVPVQRVVSGALSQ
jgi:uncharacterized membrane protein YphA (DoxX/SURF4 family)